VTPAINFTIPGGLWARHATPIAPTIPTPIPRAPLPPFDPDSVDHETGASLPVHTTLNGTLPPLEDPDYLRASLWSLTLDGLPAIPGGAGGAAQSRVLTYLFERYPPDWQQRILTAYGQAGYRQFWRSWPDERAASGRTIAQYVDDTKRVQDAGLVPAHFLRSKYYDDPNDVTNCDAVVDALLAIDGIPWAAHAWEASLWMSPAQYRAVIDHDATRAPGVRWCIHLQQAYADFGPDGSDHSVDFWEKNFAVGVRRLLYQYVTTTNGPNEPWSAGMLQARGNDVSVRCGPGGPWGLSQQFDWFAFEVVAQLQFNNQRDGDGNLADELHGDLKGYETLCTPGPVPPKGYGNGARRPEGSAL
jgi:hypothetical protein